MRSTKASTLMFPKVGNKLTEELSFKKRNSVMYTSTGQEILQQNVAIATNYDKYKKEVSKKFSEIDGYRGQKAKEVRKHYLENRVNTMNFMTDRNEKLREEVTII